jgi:L-threonylcarbamoyladenylate synthase
MKNNTLYWNSLENRQEIASLLRENQVVLCSTDTVLGLLAPLEHQAFISMNEMKGRGSQPALILIESAARWDLFTQSLQGENIIRNIMNRFWPGPLTIIGRARADLPTFMQGPGGTVALRVPGHEGLRQLLHEFDGLFSTSANLTGQPVPTTLNAVHPHIIASVAGVITDGATEYPVLPSTMIDVSSGSVKLIRQGAIAWSEIQQLLD